MLYYTVRGRFANGSQSPLFGLPAASHLSLLCHACCGVLCRAPLTLLSVAILCCAVLCCVVLCRFATGPQPHLLGIPAAQACIEQLLRGPTAADLSKWNAQDVGNTVYAVAQVGEAV